MAFNKSLRLSSKFNVILLGPWDSACKAITLRRWENDKTKAKRRRTMSKYKTLSDANSAKNDEFYTQYADIQKEINAYLDYNPDTFRSKTVL